MKVIVNATPLIALALIDRLDLLRELFDDVIVPAEVYDEVVIQGAGKPGAKLIAQTTWLQVEPPQPFSAIDPLLTGLDAGEMAVLLLAQQVRPDWVVIDERQARRVAFALGLPVKGTLGILLAAALTGLLTSQQALEDLQKMVSVGIRISPKWRNWLKAELEQL